MRSQLPVMIRSIRARRFRLLLLLRTLLVARTPVLLVLALLLAAPAGTRSTLGLDPGFRTGVKVAVVDGTGKLLETATIYPFQPRNDLAGVLRAMAATFAAADFATASIGTKSQAISLREAPSR